MSVALRDDMALTNRSVAIGREPEILAAILDPAVELALWQRRRPANLDWIDALEWDEIGDIETVIHGSDFSTGLWPLLCDAGYPQTSDGIALAKELARLAWCFARLMSCSGLRIRLEVIETDACRKFHMDYVKARLLMPLAGPGTQWTDLAVREGGAINQLGCGDVGIFKGRLLVDEPTVLHRSPPVAATGEKRLLLALDPVETC